MKKLFTTIAALILVAPWGIATAKTKKMIKPMDENQPSMTEQMPETKQPMEKMQKMKKTKMSPAKKLLKDMVYEHFTIEKGDKKYVGYFMRTKDGKKLAEKIEFEMKNKTPEEIKAHNELQKELKDAFVLYKDKKGLKTITQK